MAWKGFAPFTLACLCYATLLDIFNIHCLDLPSLQLFIQLGVHLVEKDLLKYKFQRSQGWFLTPYGRKGRKNKIRSGERSAIYNL